MLLRRYLETLWDMHTYQILLLKETFVFLPYTWKTFTQHISYSMQKCWRKVLIFVHTILEQLHWLEMFTTGLHPDADVKICFVDKGMLLISLFILITAFSIFMTFLFLHQRLLKIKCQFNQMSLTQTPALAGCPMLDALFTQCMVMLPSLYLCLLLFLLHCHLLETIMFSVSFTVLQINFQSWV